MQNETQLAEAAPGFSKHPSYKIDFIRTNKRYKLLYNGKTLAQSNDVIELFESNHDIRLYFPVVDVQMDALTETDHTSYCPFKGTARYWTVMAEGGDLENGVWAYDTPYQECQELTGHLCFYTEKPGFELLEINS